MVVRSKGNLSKRTKKIRKKSKTTITDLIKTFKVGDKVVLTPGPQRFGMPHPRYANRVGEVVSKRGSSYMVRIRDGNKKKELVAHPVHLTAAK